MKSKEMTESNKQKNLSTYDSIEQLKRNVIEDPEMQKKIEKIRNSVKRMRTKSENS